MTHESVKPYLELVEKGYLKLSRKGPLILFGYTDKCTFDRAWSEYTRRARGIIFEEETGNIVARPFPKFFNLGEIEEAFITNLPNEPYKIFDKVDGSLGIIYYYDSKWNVATRGSLSSEQAIRGQEILKKYDVSMLDTSITYLAEIIYPENRIISDYGTQEDLVLLGAIDTQTGIDLRRGHLVDDANLSGMPICKEYDLTIEQAVEKSKTLPKLEEGFVVQYLSGFRVKIKGVEYMKIAKIISHLSPLSLWEVMENGKVQKSYLEQIPEEFRAQWEPQVEKLESQYRDIIEKMKIAVKNCPVDTKNSRDLGIFVRENPGFFPIHSLIWPWIKEEKPKVDHIVHKNIRPKGNVL